MTITAGTSGHVDAGNEYDDYEEISSTTTPIVKNLTAQVQCKINLMEINKPATKVNKNKYIRDKAAKTQREETNPKSTLSTDSTIKAVLSTKPTLSPGETLPPQEQTWLSNSQPPPPKPTLPLVSP